MNSRKKFLYLLLLWNLIATQSQAAPISATPQQRTVIFEISLTLVFVALVNQPAYSILVGFPWGMPKFYVPEGYAPTIAPMSTSRLVMSIPPVVHVMPRVEETIYHSESSEVPDMYEKMYEMNDQFQELEKEMKTLREKDLFGKSASER